MYIATRIVVHAAKLILSLCDNNGLYSKGVCALLLSSFIVVVNAHESRST